MKPFIQIAVSTGHIFEIATTVIAQNRAKAMFEAHPDEFADYDAAFQDTVDLFDDGFEIRDWALNNMNPDEYIAGARLVRFVAPEQNFDSSEWSYHDAPTIIGELDGEQLLRQPVEFVLSTMATAQQMVNVTVLHDNERPFGAMVLLLGEKPVLDSFITALQFTANHIAGSAPAQTH